ncbi:MAG: hypothetical protein EBS05_10070 [Proteobacteria bacterium]|nr:hypothetical protein [Pseudomonadota bacterium]
MTSYFVNLKKANAEVSRLSGELDAVNVKLTDALAQIADHNTSAEAVTAKADATITDLTGKLTAAESRVKELEASAKTAGQIAAEVVASQGVPAAALPKEAAAGEIKAPTITRAEFTKLDARAQLKFIKDSGKITD